MAEEISDDQIVDRRMALAREWDELVEQVRAIAGFEDFLRPPKIEHLLGAAAVGPVVIVNVSRWRCDALIVELDGVRTVPLKQLTLDETARRADNYLEVLHTAEVALGQLFEAEHELSSVPGRPVIVRYRRAKQRLDATMAAVDEMLTDLQAWMWDVIADPVLTALGRTETPSGESTSWPRLWWCPTGALTILPLHSAGRLTDTGDGPRRTVLDRVVSSYTPTLRALLDARDSARQTPSDQDVHDRMLLVSAGNVDGQVPLQTEAERTVLRDLFPHSLTDLPDEEVTRDVVRSELAKHRWVHFTCHGEQNLLDPSSGGLRLRDGKLSVADISADRFRGDFAGLSACKTAIGGIELLDEAITLAAALHYTGYRHVVATLWSVEQQAAEEIFGSLYQQIVTDEVLRPELAAVALHNAVRALREQCPESPQTWTPFTHTGP